MNLLERFARGDRDAYEALFRAHQADVYRWCLRIVRDHASAEDLTMDAFYRAFRSHAHFDPGGKFPGWIRRIATNLALDHLRAAKRNVPLAPDESRPSGRDAETQRAVSAVRAYDAGAASPAAQSGGVMRRVPDESSADPAMRREARDQIVAAFAELSPKLRAVATLALIEDVPYAEIADALGISESAARVRAHRAMEFLRRKLKHLRTS
ncbi:MAG: sigma-70 family RNA polymerase sigma factor [Candidatus Acidiferrales bacterium]